MNKKTENNQITRGAAIKKMGRYAALTAVGTFLVLNPKTAHANSPLDAGGSPW